MTMDEITTTGKAFDKHDKYKTILALIAQLSLVQARKRRLNYLIIRSFLKRRRMRSWYHGKLCAQMNEVCCSLINMMTMEREQKKRSCWKLKRPIGNWFETLLVQEEESDWWCKEHLHVSRKTFLKLVDIARPHMTSKDTVFQKGTPIEKKVGASLMRLAKGESYKVISDVFELGQSSVHFYSVSFYRIILSIKNGMLEFPSDLAPVTQGFSTRTKIPNVVGVLDTLHISIIQPSAGKSDHYFNNQEHEFGLLLQCVVGPDHVFYDADVGPGGLSSDAMLEMSSFGESMKNEKILQEPKHNLAEGDVSVKPIILGNSDYTLRTWMLTPYLPYRNKITDTQTMFNNEHSKGKKVIEEAFNLLKGRWRIMTKEQTDSIRKLQNTIMPCVILHNICIQWGDDTVIDISEFEKESEEQVEKKKKKKTKKKKEEHKDVDERAVFLRDTITRNL